MSFVTNSSTWSPYLESTEILLLILRVVLQAPLIEVSIATNSCVVYKTFSTLYNRTLIVKIISKKVIEKSITKKLFPRELKIMIKVSVSFFSASYRVSHPHLPCYLGFSAQSHADFRTGIL